MKWDQAIAMIESALAEGKEVEIRYHRKYAKNVNEYRYSMVESVIPYKYKGQTKKAINLHFDQLLDSTHMVDEVYTEDTTYTGDHWVGEIVTHKGHECRVTNVWKNEGKNGITIIPTGGYGFEIDIYDSKL